MVRFSTYLKIFLTEMRIAVNSHICLGSLYAGLSSIFVELNDRAPRQNRPDGLLESLLQAYGAETTDIQSLIADFVNDNKQFLVKVFSHRFPDADDFVEDYDWLYLEPEVLLIAERSINTPLLLESVMADSNYSVEIQRMSVFFRDAADYQLV